MVTASINIDRINHLNIFLIIVSVILSYLIPFKLFLFAYTILGPLHYLTEISWLHKSNYFVQGKKDYLLLVALGVISYLANFTSIFGSLGGKIGTASILIALISSFAFLAFEKTIHRLIGIGIAIVIATALGSINSFYYSYFLSVAVFLPTLIHVCIFTFLFMLYGSMIGKSQSGYLSCAIFFIACFSFFIYTPDFNYEVNKSFLDPIKDFFYIMSTSLINVFEYDQIPYRNLSPDHYHSIFFSTAGQMFMRFIAFIYFYHYLNWFSKTSLIKWHKISWDKLIIIGTLWIISVAIYIFDYALGFQVLFILSMMHVFLEFPLNFKTIGTIGQRILKKA